MGQIREVPHGFSITFKELGLGFSLQLHKHVHIVSILASHPQIFSAVPIKKKE
jgi:hypothetical protein